MAWLFVVTPLASASILIEKHFNLVPAASFNKTKPSIHVDGGVAGRSAFPWSGGGAAGRSGVHTSYLAGF